MAGNCITTSPSSDWDARSLDNNAEYVVVPTITAPIVIRFSHCLGIDFVPSGDTPRPEVAQVTGETNVWKATFNADLIAGAVNWQLEYDAESGTREGGGGGPQPMEGPTLGPKFKPQDQC